jgi:succinate dehydrogenase / fumarate reductase, cytochrome b subunit
MWFVRFLTSSIGKKLIMATTGLLLLLFLFAHAAGNATIFMSSAVFQDYADELHSHPLIVLVFSTAILCIFIAHIAVGLYLFYENRAVSTNRYAVTTRVVKNSFASATMPYTGLFIFVFLIIHIFGFTFSPKDVPISITVKEMLSNFFYSLFYIIAFIALTVHLSHGLWSMLQTFGVNHPRFNLFIARLSLAVPLFLFLIFGGIAFYFMTGLGASY